MNRLVVFNLGWTGATAFISALEKKFGACCVFLLLCLCHMGIAYLFKPNGKHEVTP